MRRSVEIRKSMSNKTGQGHYFQGRALLDVGVHRHRAVSRSKIPSRTICTEGPRTKVRKYCAYAVSIAHSCGSTGTLGKIIGTRAGPDFCYAVSCQHCQQVLLSCQRWRLAGWGRGEAWRFGMAAKEIVRSFWF